MQPATLARPQRGAVNLVVVLLIVLIVVLLGTGGGLALYLSKLSAAPAVAVPANGAAPAADAAPQGKPIYMGIEPALIVNFDRNGRIGFLQASVQLMARDQLVLDAAREHMPVVRNNLLMLFSGKGYQEMSGREAREALRLEALDEVNKVLEAQGAPGKIEELYFTGFVMQ